MCLIYFCEKPKVDFSSSQRLLYMGSIFLLGYSTCGNLILWLLVVIFKYAVGLSWLVVTSLTSVNFLLICCHYVGNEAFELDSVVAVTKDKTYELLALSIDCVEAW